MSRQDIRIDGDATGSSFVAGNHNIIKMYFDHKTVSTVQADQPTQLGPNPYQSLSAFNEKTAKYFFGREKLTRKLWNTFRELNEPGTDENKIRLLPILGPSGSGKSSLARAGLLYELDRNPLPGMKSARVAVMTPGSEPLESLAGILARMITNDPAPVARTREFKDELKIKNDCEEYDGICRIIQHFPDITSSPLIILVDQFEEIFVQCENTEDRHIFIRNLLHAASEKSGHVSVILTLRSDFLGETQSDERLNRVIAQHAEIVPVMNREELRKAIAMPAETAGHPLDQAVVNMLIDQTYAREGALPMLQFALTRIWDKLAEGVEPAETLKEIGGGWRHGRRGPAPV